MLFKPRNCPNCGIKWSDGAKPGACDLCGYDLRLGRQPGPERRMSGGRRTVDAEAIGPIERRPHRKIRQPKISPQKSAGYRPFLPGIEVRDPERVLDTVDPAAVADMRNFLGNVLGEKVNAGAGPASASQMKKVQAALHTMATWSADPGIQLYIDSKGRDLPVQVTVYPADQYPDADVGQPVETSGQEQSGRLTKIMRVLLFIGALIYMLIAFFLENR